MQVPAVLPMRVMTVGETLDAATALLRARALPLLALAAVLAGAEQLLLTPLRAEAGLPAPVFLPSWDDDAGPWWLLVATGLTLETVIIAVLGAYAGAAAGPALLGRTVPHRRLWRRTRPLSVLVVIVLLGLLSWPAALFGLLPWIVLYGLFGLAVPVLTLDRAGGPFRALGRSAALSVRAGGRVMWTRLLGYLVWFAIRFALGTGWTAVTTLFVTTVRGEWLEFAVPIAYALANTAAYAALACLDAVLLVEIRIRTEGLDIALGRRRARGEDEAAGLAVAR
ncbi:hypothetical protein AB0F81_49520 [Actinoplanes sp. NPDC024001]|uniref:hypothetical protein n=1 Tax=Actinoplanes sp. NPDC024001 TaxID=3154598 RepID=UPI0033E00A24